jgi:serine/threonine protein kinase
MIGEQILNYRIISKIGDGGMGSVYLAQHVQLGRQAAIKALHANLVNNPHIRERFKNEAATMAHLQHNNIVALYDYLESTSGLFLIMEFVQGKPLDELIKTISGPIAEEKAIGLFAQVLDGFEYAHNQGVVHRDIKPSNLIITPTGEVKILDFGIAKLLADSSKSLTKTGSRMGTVLYMSPEQVKGQEVDRRSDIYSLGVTLFQMLTGRCPYNESSVTEYEVYHQIVNSPLPRAKLFYPKVTERMQVIIDKATAKNPAERFQSCAEFKRAMQGQAMNSLANTTPNPLVKPYLGRTMHDENANAEITSNSPYTSKIRRKRTANFIWLLVFVITLLSGGALVALNPFDWEVLRPYTLMPTPLFVNPEPIVQERVKKFYEAVETQNFANIAPFYADSLQNYFNNLNRSLVPDIKTAYEIYWNQYQDERHEIDWDSFEFSQDEAGNSIVRLRMKYNFKMKGKDWDYVKRGAEIRLNPEFKIFYITTAK